MQTRLHPHAVLYTHDLEPITVLRLTPLAQHYLRERGVVCIAVEPPLSLMTQPGPPPNLKMRTVCITAELFRRGRQESLMLFTTDEEDALLLRSALLPGQVRDARSRERDAFAAGFIKALANLGGA